MTNKKTHGDIVKKISRLLLFTKTFDILPEIIMEYQI